MIQYSALCIRFRLWPISGFAALLIATACTQVPELDATIPAHLRNAPYPALVPLDDALFAAPLPQVQSQEIERSLTARRDRLQSRAKGLNASVVDPEARKRMLNGVGR